MPGMSGACWECPGARSEGLRALIPGCALFPQIIEGKAKAHLILDDPAGNSYLQVPWEMGSLTCCKQFEWNSFVSLWGSGSEQGKGRTAGGFEGRKMGMVSVPWNQGLGMWSGSHHEPPAWVLLRGQSL